jgi:hypothetical protein
MGLPHQLYFWLLEGKVIFRRFISCKLALRPKKRIWKEECPTVYCHFGIPTQNLGLNFRVFPPAKRLEEQLLKGSGWRRIGQTTSSALKMGIPMSHSY